jgi:hypothetical protein
MIKQGDAITAKPSFLLRYGIPYEHRKLNVDFFEDGMISVSNEYIKNNIKGQCIWGSFDFLKEFYLNNSITQEILALIEQGVEFDEINAVTVEGKIIDIRRGIK